jgi:hypothetical protein
MHRGRRDARLTLVAGLLLPVGLVPVAPSPAAALICTVIVDGDAVATPAVVLQAALDAADAACPQWTVRLRGAVLLGDAPLVYDRVPALHLIGDHETSRAIIGGGGHRILTVRRPAGEVTLERLELHGGNARGRDLGGAGGAVALEGALGVVGRLTIRDALLADNVAATGGALAADEILLEDVELRGNTADTGGALTSGTLVGERVTFDANEAVGTPSRGGAVVASGDVTLVNATFSGNSADEGASLWVDGVSGGLTVRLVFVTLVEAAAAGGAAHIHAGSDGAGGVGVARLVLRGSVLAGALGRGGAPLPPLCAGMVVVPDAAGPDLTVGALATDASCPGAVGLLVTEPYLGPLEVGGSSGSPAGTTRSRAPAAVGPLVDVVACDANWPQLDQRGSSRPQPAGGMCDAGAVEIEVAGVAPPAEGGADAEPAEVAVLPPVPAVVRAGGGSSVSRPWSALLRVRSAR